MKTRRNLIPPVPRHSSYNRAAPTEIVSVDCIRGQQQPATLREFNSRVRIGSPVQAAQKSESSRLQILHITDRRRQARSYASSSRVTMESNLSSYDFGVPDINDGLPFDPIDPNDTINDFDTDNFDRAMTAPHVPGVRLPAHQDRLFRPFANQSQTLAPVGNSDLGLPHVANQVQGFPLAVNNGLLPPFNSQDQVFMQQPGNHVNPNEATTESISEANKQVLIAHVTGHTQPLHNKIGSLEHDVEVQKVKVRRLEQAVKDRDNYIASHHLDPLAKVNFDGVEAEARVVLPGHGNGNTDAVPDLEGADETDASNQVASAPPKSPVDASVSTPEAALVDGNDPVEDHDSTGTKRKAIEMAPANDELLEDASDKATTAELPEAKKVKKSTKGKDRKNTGKTSVPETKANPKKNKKAENVVKQPVAVAKQPGTKAAPSQVTFETKIFKFYAETNEARFLNQVCTYVPVLVTGSGVARHFLKEAVGQLPEDHKSNPMTGILLVQQSALEPSKKGDNTFVELQRGQLQKIYSRLQLVAKEGGDRVERRFLCVICKEAELSLLHDLISATEIKLDSTD